MYSQKVKNDSLETIGEIRRDENNIYYYHTERDNRKNQIYLKKTVFLSADSKEFLQGENVIGISLSIVKELLSKEVKYVHFVIKNFPNPMEHFLGKIELIDFLNKSITIQERGYDKQRITPLNNLEVIRRY